MITRNKIGLVLLLLFFLSCKERRQPLADTEQIKLPPLVEVMDLQHKMTDTELMIIDMRKPEFYHQGHIEGAVNIWRDQIEDTNYPYGGMMATKDSIEKLFGGLGISNNHNLVIYDDRGSPDAARLWWLLKFYNHNQVSLLNGGLKAWKESGEKLSKEPVLYPPTAFQLPDTNNTTIWIDKEELVADLKKKESEIILIDARTKAEYRGQTLKSGAKKAGRIPGSIHLDWARAVDFEGDKKIRSTDELRVLFEENNISNTDTVVVYCHSGSRSSLTTFVLLELLGYPNVKNYDGSWTEWSYYDELPFEQDSLTKTKSL